MLGEAGYTASLWRADGTLAAVDGFAGDADYLFRVAP